MRLFLGRLAKQLEEIISKIDSLQTEINDKMNEIEDKADKQDREMTAREEERWDSLNVDSSDLEDLRCELENTLDYIEDYSNK